MTRSRWAGEASTSQPAPPASCDTVVVYSGSAQHRRGIFAKNSDRSWLECQPLAQVPAQDHPLGAAVHCQYVTIPQVRRTLAVLGSRPWWLWGFEHGVNAAGVAIGNEAIYTRDPVPASGLLGMDLVRLGLERGASAAEAKDVITRLIERHGQGGSASVSEDRRYQNSFIVADRAEAWVIEASGHHWVAKRTTSGAVIANLVTIEDDWDESSAGLEAHARDLGYGGEAKVPFRAIFEDVSSRPVTEPRYAVGCRLLARGGDHDVRSMIRYLRDHFESGDVHRPDPGGTPRRTVCLHPGAEPLSTAASMVVELSDDTRPPVAWVSMATPCTGVFVPLTVGQPLPAALETGGERPADGSHWWAMHELQSLADRDPGLMTPIARAAWGPLERELLATDPRQSLPELESLLDRIAVLRSQVMRDLVATQPQRT